MASYTMRTQSIQYPYTIRTISVRHAYTIRTPSVHDPYSIRTQSVHHTGWLASGYQQAMMWLQLALAGGLIVPFVETPPHRRTCRFRGLCHANERPGSADAPAGFVGPDTRRVGLERRKSHRQPPAKLEGEAAAAERGCSRSRHSGNKGKATSSASKSHLTTTSVSGILPSMANLVACGILSNSTACPIAAAQPFAPAQYSRVFLLRRNTLIVSLIKPI
jgi:hypothetical protein